MPNGDSVQNDPSNVYREDERRLQIWATKAPADAAILAAGLTGVIGFATTAVNSAVILNGAAATAILALLGSVWGTTGADVLPILLPVAANCLKYFGIGAAAAVCAAAFSYLSQIAFNEYMVLMLRIENLGIVAPKSPEVANTLRGSRRTRIIGEVFRGLALVAFTGSVLSFGLGATDGLHALEVVALVFPR